LITNNGKQIIGKFLLRQAPEFATHIAAGCGKMPLFPNQGLSTEEITDLKEKQSLDFEVFRVPISSKGFIKEDGVEKIVFKAEMPTEERYLISEIGFYPADANILSGAFDSKTLSIFVPTESWVIYAQESSSNVLNITNETQFADELGNIVADDVAYFLPSGSNAFEINSRRSRQEGPRFYSQALSLSGSAALISELFVPSPDSYRLENAALAFNLSQNLPTDEIKIAINILSKDVDNDTNPNKVRIIFDFVNDLPGLDLQSPKARLNIEFNASDFIETGTGQSPDPINRYKIVNRTLSDFLQDDTFSWANINLIRIYGCVLDSGGNPTEDYNIVFDGLRLENVSTENPLYSLVGYDIIKNDSAYPILKSDNTNNFIEYRFGIGVDE
jgi:hypothetical protein